VSHAHPSPSHNPASLRLACAALCALGLQLPLRAQEERAPGWYDQAEVSFVQTGGNAEASTLALKNALERVWEDALFAFRAGALRAESSTFTRFAVGTPDDFDVVEDETSELTAENYFANFRYDHELRPDFFWFASLGWERNEFAGFSDRTIGTGGVGQIWWEREGAHFRTDYGLTYTRQDDLVENPEIDDSFVGLRLAWDYLRPIGARASYQNLLVVHENLDETDDLRADWTNSLQAAMTERLALKVGLQLLWDHLPALAAVPLLEDGAPTGTVVLAELDELDTLFTAALVVTF
jgi:putative salt-induced outer membrane protein YdiY